jgi:cytochrome c
VNRTLATLGAGVGIAALALTGGLLAQSKSKSGAKDPAAAARGKELFQQKCSICHFDTSTAKKIGPGLKGIGKRGTFTVNSNKVTDETLTKWIDEGDSLMPPFKEVLDEKQIKDVVAYVKTL